MNRERIRAWVVNAILVVTAAVSLVAYNNFQRHQYEEVTDRIDRNTRAIVCVFSIDPTKLPRRDTPEYQVAVRKVIQDCFRKYGVAESK